MSRPALGPPAPKTFAEAVQSAEASVDALHKIRLELVRKGECPEHSLEAWRVIAARAEQNGARTVVDVRAGQIVAADRQYRRLHPVVRRPADPVIEEAACPPAPNQLL